MDMKVTVPFLWKFGLNTQYRPPAPWGNCGQVEIVLSWLLKFLYVKGKSSAIMGLYLILHDGAVGERTPSKCNFVLHGRYRHKETKTHRNTDTQTLIHYTLTVVRPDFLIAKKRSFLLRF